MSIEKDDIIATLKSCLLTFKNGTTLAGLSKDYKTLEGRSIPFHQLGYPSLEAFVQSVPGIRTMRRDTELIVESVPSKETEHISRLIAGQNQAKKRRRRTSNLRYASRSAQGMSRNNMRAVSSAYKASSCSRSSGNYNVRHNVAPQLSQYAPKPLTSQPTQRPASLAEISIGNYRGGSGIGTLPNSSSKRMGERHIQPHQELDYMKSTRTVTIAPANVPSSRPSTMLPSPEIPPMPKIRPLSEVAPLINPRQVETRPSRSVVESSITENPPMIRPLVLEPAMPRATGIPWQPPRSRLCDRLTVLPTSNPFNSTVTNGSGGIQITFPNVNNENGANQQTLNPILQDPRDELRAIALELNKPDPIYKIIPVHGKSSSTVYGKVQVGSAKFSSYPKEAQTEVEAEKLAAVEALIELRLEHSSALRLRLTTDKSVMKTRLLSIVDQHNGVFTHKIPSIYREEFRENLPEDWTKDIECWPELTLDQGVHDSWILRRADEGKALKPIMEKGFLQPIGSVEPGLLELPNDNYWVAYVTLVASSTDIWARVIDENYSEKLEAMAVEMTQHYAVNDKRSEIIEGRYYVKEENNVWHRVRVIECDSKSYEAEVFFIDIGDVDTVKKCDLFPLDRKFCSLSAQAIKLSLSGLEDFANSETATSHIAEVLTDRAFYVEELSRDIDEEGPIASVIFCDTSGPQDVNVNHLVLMSILQAFTPRFENEAKATVVYVSHVEANGDVYVQVENEALKTLADILNKVTHTGLSKEDLKRCAFKSYNPGMVYFAQCRESNNWFRTKFVDPPISSEDSHRVKMFLVDFGRTITVSLGNVIDLELLCLLLTQFPAQAVKVRLDNIDAKMLNETMIEKIKELAPPNQILRSKIVKPSTGGGPPTIELFKKIQPENVLVSINNTLVLEPELGNTDGDGNNNVRSARRRVERANSRASVDVEETARALPAPKIGEIGTYFEVHVTMAAHPTNFTVQPLAYADKLSAMMGDLQKACANPFKEPHPTLESIKEGRLYATRHSDGAWYRGCVLNVINEHTISVYFVDYGDVDILSLEKLQSLPKRFLDLPYQGIKARLVGIKPRNIDWTPEDCVRFQQLVVDGNFVSTIAAVYPDRHLPRDTVLGLKLIDTSSNEDVHIEKLMGYSINTLAVSLKAFEAH